MGGVVVCVYVWCAGQEWGVVDAHYMGDPWLHAVDDVYVESRFSNVLFAVVGLLERAWVVVVCVLRVTIVVSGRVPVWVVGTFFHVVCFVFRVVCALYIDQVAVIVCFARRVAGVDVLVVLVASAVRAGSPCTLD